MNRLVLLVLVGALSACMPAVTSAPDASGGGGGGAAATGGGGGGGDRFDAGIAADPPFDCSGDAGRCFFVAPNGSDTNPGTLDAPYGTFRLALDNAEPGDTIVARGGRYGAANAMIVGTEVDFRADGGQASCPNGKLQDGICWFDSQGFLGISDVNSAYATNAPLRSVASGRADALITVRNYPGERPVLDMTDLNNREYAVLVRAKSYWMIRGLEIYRGKIDLRGNTSRVSAHDIHIVGNEIHGASGAPGFNTGLIFIQRSDGAPVYNVFIRDNLLHDSFYPGYEGNTEDVGLQQHLGAVTTMSCEGYTDDLDCGGTGRIEITGNRIWRIPQIFFFKNAMAGPILIENNVITEAGSLGCLASANVTFRNNLVVDTNGFDRGGGDSNPVIRNSIDSNNGRFERNTFVNADFAVRSTGATGHQFGGNVYFNPRGRRTGAGYDTTALYMMGEEHRQYEPDDVTQSLFQTWDSGSNCIVSPHEDVLLVKRFSQTRLEHFTVPDAGALFGFDLDSVVVSSADPAAVFENPDAGDYRVRASSACSGKGYVPPAP